MLLKPYLDCELFDDLRARILTAEMQKVGQKLVLGLL
jgi:hypothetical protein